MKQEIKVLWKKGDGEMPENVKHVVDIAKGEVLLRSLGVSDDLANEIRYNADKNAQSVKDYILDVVVGSLAAPSIVS